MITEVFLDTEFIDNGPGQSLKLISIGLVKSNGESYYRVSNEFTDEELPEWHKKHILPVLGEEERVPRAQMAGEIKEFLKGCTPSFIGWFSAYDWVIVCQIFGSMLSLPAHWPQFCIDIRQIVAMEMRKDPDFGIKFQFCKPPKPTNEHNAVADAYWTRDLYSNLKTLL